MEKLYRAIAFAIKAHAGQKRKVSGDDYVIHPIRVMLRLKDLSITDENILCAAVLHDTIEDTRTDFDDLKWEFNESIALHVSTLSKDKRLHYSERELQYLRQIKDASFYVRLIKLSDLYDNALESTHKSFFDKHRQVALDLAKSIRNEPALSKSLVTEKILTFIDEVERIYRSNSDMGKILTQKIPWVQ